MESVVRLSGEKLLGVNGVTVNHDIQLTDNIKYTNVMLDFVKKHLTT